MCFLKTILFCEQYHKNKWQKGTEISEEIAVSLSRVSVAQKDKDLEEGGRNILRKVGD